MITLTSHPVVALSAIRKFQPPAYWPTGLLAYWPIGLLAYWPIGERSRTLSRHLAPIFPHIDGDGSDDDEPDDYFLGVVWNIEHGATTYE